MRLLLPTAVLLLLITCHTPGGQCQDIVLDDHGYTGILIAVADSIDYDAAMVPAIKVIHHRRQPPSPLHSLLFFNSNHAGIHHAYHTVNNYVTLEDIII